MRRLAAQHLLPGEGDDVELRPVEVLGEGRRGGVADGEALAVGRDPVAVGHPHARRRAVPGEDDVVVEVDVAEIGKLAVGRLQRADVLDLELLDDIGDPAVAKALPRQHVDAARAEQGPERHLDRAGVGAGRDADAVVGRDAEHLAGQVDRQFELGLADLRAMRTAQGGVFEDFGGPAGALGAGAGRKAGVRRPDGRRLNRHLDAILSDGRLSLGRGVPPRLLADHPRIGKGEPCAALLNPRGGGDGRRPFGRHDATSAAAGSRAEATESGSSR